MKQEEFAMFKIVAYDPTNVRKYNRSVSEHNLRTWDKDKKLPVREPNNMFDIFVSTDDGITWKQVATSGVELKSRKVDSPVCVVGIPLFDPFGTLEFNQLELVPIPAEGNDDE